MGGSAPEIGTLLSGARLWARCSAGDWLERVAHQTIQKQKRGEGGGGGRLKQGGHEKGGCGGHSQQAHLSPSLARLRARQQTCLMDLSVVKTSEQWDVGFWQGDDGWLPDSESVGGRGVEAHACAKIGNGGQSLL